MTMRGYVVGCWLGVGVSGGGDRAGAQRGRAGPLCSKD